jgi:hypothetical protein
MPERASLIRAYPAAPQGATAPAHAARRRPAAPGGGARARPPGAVQPAPAAPAAPAGPPAAAARPSRPRPLPRGPWSAMIETRRDLILSPRAPRAPALGEAADA